MSFCYALFEGLKLLLKVVDTTIAVLGVLCAVRVYAR